MPETIYLSDPPQRQPQQQQGMNPFQMYNMYNTFWGGGGTGGQSGIGGGGFLGSMGPYAAIAAAIAAQQIMAQNTNTEFEGQRSGGITSGNFTTEPWLGFLSQEMGWGPTAGEKFDASVKNNDPWDMFRRAPAAFDYWADPARGFLGHAARNTMGKWPAMFLDPIGGLFSWLGD